ncbi:hypothetical protein J2S36_000523 [Arcanobacterium hippocoleae]|uniref:Uncharacterized protein n=1 Tax=Arcanobacterium hippocoleae TaxID=149017 RepID=A0ABU1T0V2_9ACTO|nr:hypothetical protein [Arcanobacterium hippocoleae]
MLHLFLTIAIDNSYEFTKPLIVELASKPIRLTSK